MAIRRRSPVEASKRASSLSAYRRKRDLRVSGEPAGAARTSAAGMPRFVIQKHDASRLHYDLRLEMDGVLRSWAVPKGLPTETGKKALAIEVEDHPLDYGEFEGNIPSGNYGAGTVMLWDRGFYKVKGANPVTAWRRGRIHLALAGEKLLGEWSLIRLPSEKTKDKRNWIVLKHDDSARSRRPRIPLERSVLTRRTLEEIAANAEPARPKPAVRKRTRGLPAPRGTSRRAPPKFIEPMKALAVPEVPDGNWSLELKFDGYRALALAQGGQVTLHSRNGRDLTGEFPEITDALAPLRADSALIDGEIVALDAEGRPSFQLLQQRGTGRRPRLIFYAFDLLHLDGAALLDEKLELRQQRLGELLRKLRGPVKISPTFEVDPATLLTEVRQRGLEGIIAKRRGSNYEPGRRSGAWLKCRVVNEQEFVIGGYTAPQGARAYFGALLVGYFERGTLLYAGKVGTGFGDRQLRSLHARFQPHVRSECPFANLPQARRSRFGGGMTAAEMREVTWLKPTLVCQVRFTEWTDESALRHPVFVGLRDDKAAREVRREIAARK
jgi:bifunctional non-homologous end joining protein LigD